MNKSLYYDISLEDFTTQNLSATKIKEISARSMNLSTHKQRRKLKFI